MGACDCPLPAGSKRNLVSVERPAISSDGLRGEDVTWNLYRQVWCKMTFKSGAEPFDRDALREEATVEFLMSYVDGSDLLITDRFVFEGKAYNIRLIDDIEFRKQTLRFSADRGVAQ